MATLFSKWAKIASPALLVVYPLAVVLVFISGVLMVEDFRTSYAGYQALPTAKAGTDWVPFAVAALPQVGQIVLGYIAIAQERRWSMILSLVFFIVDVGTDVTFKIHGDNSLIPLAIVESIFIFTIGSEVLFTLSVGFIAESTSEFMGALGELLKSLADAVSRFFSVLSDGDNHPGGGQRR